MLNLLGEFSVKGMSVIIPEVLGTIPQWITAASITAFLGVIGRWHLGKVKLSIAAREVEVSAIKVTNADEADKRDHFADEMTALRGEVTHLRNELHECEDQCRREIKSLQNELWGEKRQRVAEQISFINLILNSVDAPELKTLLTTLEKTQIHLIQGLPAEEVPPNVDT
jgi:hypothetical protein